MTATASDATSAEPDLLVLAITARRIVDRDVAHAYKVWPAVYGVVDPDQASKLLATLAGDQTTIKQGTATIAVARSAFQSFVLPLGDDFQVLFQAEGWRAGDRVELDRLRFQSNYQLALGTGTHAEPPLPMSITIPIGGVAFVQMSEFSNAQLAYTELLEIDATAIASRAPAAAATAPSSPRSGYDETWAAWPKIAKQALP